MYKVKYIILSLCFFCLSCSSSNDDEILDIGKYIFDNNLEILETNDGIYVSVIEVGEPPLEQSVVNIKYKGYYLDKEVFDSTKTDLPITISTSSLINGLRQGLNHFGKGGKGTIIIPEKLGYSSNPPRGIRKNATLIYDIELF